MATHHFQRKKGNWGGSQEGRWCCAWGSSLLLGCRTIFFPLILTISRVGFNSFSPITFLPPLVGQGCMELWVNSILKWDNLFYYTELYSSVKPNKIIAEKMASCSRDVRVNGVQRGNGSRLLEQFWCQSKENNWLHPALSWLVQN